MVVNSKSIDISSSDLTQPSSQFRIRLLGIYPQKQIHAVMYQWGKLDCRIPRFAILIYLTTVSDSPTGFKLSPPLRTWTPWLWAAWCWKRGSNTQPADYKSAALPIVLFQHFGQKDFCHFAREKICKLTIFTLRRMLGASHLKIILMAERVGFEPTVRFRTPVFKTSSLNLSDISPKVTNQLWCFFSQLWVWFRVHPPLIRMEESVGFEPTN